MDARFSPDELKKKLAILPRSRRYCVAYSGGPDSHGLLFALHALRSELGGELVAVHVNHALQADADVWQKHCQSVCRTLAMPFFAFSVAVTSLGCGPEAAARAARYRVLSKFLTDGDVLLTAHTEDDQAETLLLQLLRGSGPNGLAGMPVRARCGSGWLLRPLLDVARARLHAFVSTLSPAPIDDPSNLDRALNRNYLRHQILPELEARWPAVVRTLARASRLQAEAGHLLRQMGAEDLASLRVAQSNSLSCAALLELESARRHNAIREWIRAAGYPPPSATQLSHLDSDVLRARADGRAQLAWGNTRIRRYRDHIHILGELPAFEQGGVYEWQLDSVLSLPHGELSASQVRGDGFALEPVSGALEVRFRQGGESCRPVRRGHSCSLKRLFQEHAVPPWLRNRIPLIYIAGKLAAVAGVCVCKGFEAGPDDVGWKVCWRDYGSAAD